VGPAALVVLFLALGGALGTPRVPPAHASQTVNLTNTEIQITSDPSTFSTGEINTYTCPSGYPYFVNWKDNSSGGKAFTYSQWNSGGSGNSGDPDWVSVHFGALGTATDSIVYLCSSQWPPTTADCGGEGQPECWGAVQGYAPGTPKQGWMRADEMFYANGSGICDHSLIGGTDYTCKDSGRHQLNSNSWENWALDNQRYGISGQEPINWYTTLGTHESFNTRADTYTFPNQTYSISDQLTAGARYIDLRPRWICCAPYYEKLSHTLNSGSTTGAATGDRAYTYAIEEIATWLQNNPTQVILLDIGIGTGDAAAPDPSYLYDPVDKYLNTLVLTPLEWCNYLHTTYPNVSRPDFGSDSGISEANCAGIGASGTYIPYRWPSTDEMHALGKQVIIITNNGGITSGGTLGEGYAFENLSSSGNDMDGSAGYSGSGNSFVRNFAGSSTIDPTANSDATSCTRNSIPYLYNSDATAQQRDFYNRVWTTLDEARVWGEAEFTPSSWPGYVVANAADVAVLSKARSLPGSDQATSLEAITDCNVGIVKLDEFANDNAFNSEAFKVTGLADRRDGAIWSWASGDYGTGGDCAVLGAADNKWHSRPCTEVHHFACALPRTGDPTTWPDVLQENWRITQGTGAWNEGEQICHEEFGSTVITSLNATGLVFSSPRNGRADQELIVERNNEGFASEDLWLAYSTTGGAWHTGAAPVLQVTATSGGQPYTFGSWTFQPVYVNAQADSEANPSTSIANIIYKVFSSSGNQIGGGTLTSSGTIQVSQEGISAVFAEAEDASGTVGPASKYVIKIDTTPPFSTLQHDASSYQSGGQTFVTSGTRFTVSGTDDVSGIANVAYRYYPVNGLEPNVTVVPGQSASFTLSGADGAYIVETYATDIAGKSSYPQMLPVILDNAAPTVTIAQAKNAVYTHSGILTLRYRVSDGSGSGVHTYTPLLDGLTTIDGHGLASGQRINLLTALRLGRHTFTISQATDNLGNSRTVRVSFTLIVTGSSVVADVAQFMQSGAISNVPWGNSIAAALRQAARAGTAGQCSDARAMYLRVLQQTSRVRGSGWITASAATILNGDLRYLILRCA
jgi:hypothetical protein